jgi:chromosomal replication initiator protein
LVTSVAKAICTSPGFSAYNPLFVFGKSGVGKTHISQAIAHKVLSTFPDKTVLYVTANTFRTQFVDASLKNAVNSFLHFYQKIDLLIIDDIHDFIDKRKTQDVFFHIFNHLHQMKKQLILTCDRPLSELEGLSERLITRFKWGLPVKIEIPDYETRLKILKFKMYRDGIEISEDLLEYAAKNLQTSVREIEGFYISLVAHSTLNQKTINVALIDEILTNFISRKEVKELSVEEIREQVASYFKITVDDINSRSRKRNIVQARQIVMHLAKELTNFSLAAIGSVLGNRNHATVLYALKSVKNLVDTDHLFKSDLERIKEKIGVAN